MSEPRCDITDLLVSQCGHCKGLTEDKPELGPWFAARFEGFCSRCGDAIEPGDPIRADGEGGYLDHDCGGTP